LEASVFGWAIELGIWPQDSGVDISAARTRLVVSMRNDSANADEEPVLKRGSPTRDQCLVPGRSRMRACWPMPQAKKEYVDIRRGRELTDKRDGFNNAVLQY
jgi:hypothetical protein